MESATRARIRNARSWWQTFFRGPKFVGQLIPRLGNNVETITLDKDEPVVLHNPHERMDEEYLFEDATILTFGHAEVPDWNKVTLSNQRNRAEAVNGDSTPQKATSSNKHVIEHLVQGLMKALSSVSMPRIKHLLAKSNVDHGMGQQGHAHARELRP